MNFDLKIPTFSIDFVGQRKSEKLFQIIVSVFAFFAFIWGFYVQKFSHTLIILGAGVVVSGLLILPPWPQWNKNPIKWQKPIENEKSEQSGDQTKETTVVKKKK